ncbi:MAG: hypothetical protein PHS47_03560 [Methanocellales archaeon]|nr:hypothetical protein [Methanocellales archaeon]MDD5446924.1 hypothetical protein [Methanocellales archaeon]
MVGKKNDYGAGEELYNKTKDDLKYFRKIYNKLKHTNRVIRTINFHRNKSAVMGYYIEAVSDDGSVGPDEDFHPKYQNMHSANSYNLTLKMLYYSLYQISDFLKDVIINQVKDFHKKDLKFNSDYKTDTKTWEELFYKIQNLPNIYFPNEFGKATCDVKIENGKLILQTKSAESTDLSKHKIEIMTFGDGFTRNYRMPFMKPG